MNPLLRNSALDSIDAELDERHLAALESSLRAANPRDDQATRLRALVDDQPQAPVARVGGAALRDPWRDSPSTAAAETRTESLPAHKPSWSSPSPKRTSIPILTIASGKGGVGKTNISVNLAIALAQRNLRVTLLDADLGTANADLLCGISPSARLDHVLAPGGLAWQDGAHRTIRDIAIDAPGGFRLVPGAAGVSRLTDLPLSEQRTLFAALHQLEADADLLIIDAAAGVGRAVTAMMHAADLTLIVTTPEPTALADAYALTKCAVLGATHPQTAHNHDQEDAPLEAIANRLALVVNQIRDPLEAFAVHARFNKVTDRFLGCTIPMHGFIAQDLLVPQAVRAQKPLLLHAPGAPAALNICDLASAVINRLGVQPRPAAIAPPAAPSKGISTLVRRLLGFSSSVA